MALDGSPKKLAQDVSTGLININQATLKRYTLPEIQKIQIGLQTVQKELRNIAVESGDHQALKDKGLKMQRVNGAMRAIQLYIKENKWRFNG